MTRTAIPPRLLREWRHELVAFRDCYVTYLNQTLGNERPIPQAKRSEVVRRAHKAQTVMTRLGADFAWQSSPATGGEVMRGLLNTIFVHESPFGGIDGTMFNWPKSYEGIINIVDTCLSRLEELEAESHRTRRNPFYWGDRVLSALLGFPAYLLGKLLGVPATRIDESPFGIALRIAAFFVEATAVALALNEHFHWF
jgi:hypothetical protein